MNMKKLSSNVRYLFCVFMCDHKMRPHATTCYLLVFCGRILETTRQRRLTTSDIPVSNGVNNLLGVVDCRKVSSLKKFKVDQKSTLLTSHRVSY